MRDTFWTPVKVAFCVTYFAALCIFMAIVGGVL